ncbi:MAG: T9SS type A sorting domain-containing protein, partial [Rhizobiales bacterium]|nr:T9SS type A sorting domain-containing protein [Hyphomicrobiales bacterium]
MNIYPNPTSNQLTIDTELEVSEINIIDITGKIIMTTKRNTNTINVTTLSDGIY